MKRFFVISNFNRDPEEEHAKRISDYLIGKDCSCTYLMVDRIRGALADEKDISSQIPEGTECVIVLGGDGTIIQVAGVLAKRQIPLIGINIGNIGFLAETELDNVYECLDRLVADDFTIEERMMLEGQITIGGKVHSSGVALNDVVITRSGPLRVINYEIYVNGKLLTMIPGDGVIVSSPTGSTGYSMSAGGPIVEPDSKVILITPISPHKLSLRPIILSPLDEIRVKVKSGYVSDSNLVQASVDGGKVYNLYLEDEVLIKRATEVTRVIKMSKESFLEVLARKITT